MKDLIGKPIGSSLYTLRQIIPRNKLVRTARHYKNLNLKPNTSLDFLLGFFAVGIFYGYLSIKDCVSAVEQLIGHFNLIEITMREQWMI